MIQTLKNLYDYDFVLWTEDTVTKLQLEDFHNLDIENLIEEIESLGRAEKHELRSRLETLLEYILSGFYVNLPECNLIQTNFANSRINVVLVQNKDLSFRDEVH